MGMNRRRKEWLRGRVRRSKTVLRTEEGFLRRVFNALKGKTGK